MSPIALSQLFLVSGLKPWRNGNEHNYRDGAGPGLGTKYLASGFHSSAIATSVLAVTAQ
jgi:hypothetical protein